MTAVPLLLTAAVAAVIVYVGLSWMDRRAERAAGLGREPGRHRDGHVLHVGPMYRLTRPEITSRMLAEPIVKLSENLAKAQIEAQVAAWCDKMDKRRAVRERIAELRARRDARIARRAAEGPWGWVTAS